MEEIRKYEGVRYSKEEWDTIVDFLNNILVSGQNGYNTIDNLATKLKLLELARTSTFANVGGGDAALDETTDVHRSGKTGFGEQDPKRIVDIIGDFALKNAISGVTYSIELGNDLLKDAGVAAGMVKGVIIWSKTGNDLHYVLIGNSSALTGVSAPLSLGVINLTDFNKYARTTVSKDANGNYFIQDENGVNTRHRKTVFAHEFLNKLNFHSYGNGNINEGVVVDADTTVEKPDYILVIGADHTVSELPISLLDKKAPITGQYVLKQDGSYTTQENLEGKFDSKKTALAGNAANPVYHWGCMGIGFFKKGTILKRVEMHARLRYDDRGFDDVEIDISRMNESVEDAGWDSSGTQTTTNILPPTGIKGSLSLGKRQPYEISLGDYKMPNDGIVLVSFRGIGTLTADEDLSVNGDVIYQEPWPNSII